MSESNTTTLLNILLEFIGSNTFQERTVIEADPWLVIIDPARSRLTLARNENMPPPASFQAIENLPVAEVVDPSSECIICLSAFGRDKVKQLPCGHRFHTHCIETWLLVNGTCPVCRYQMPVELDLQITFRLRMGDDVDSDYTTDDDDDDEDESDDDGDESGGDGDDDLTMMMMNMGVDNDDV